MNISSPWMTTDQAAEWLCLFKKDGTPNRLAVRRRLKRRGIVPDRLGKEIRIRKEDVASMVTPGKRVNPLRRTA